MTINYIEEFDYVVAMLSTMKLMMDFNKGKELLNMYRNCEFDPDYQFDLFYMALQESAEFFESDVDKDDDSIYIHTLSDKVVTEYYRLCKQYSRRKKVKFKDNPYVKKADDYVAGQMNGINDWGISWELITDTKSEYSSLIKVYLYPEFMQTVELIESILYSLDFYKNEIEILKAELAPKIKGNKNSNVSEVIAA